MLDGAALRVMAGDVREKGHRFASLLVGAAPTVAAWILAIAAVVVTTLGTALAYDWLGAEDPVVAALATLGCTFVIVLLLHDWYTSALERAHGDGGDGADV